MSVSERSFEDVGGVDREAARSDLSAVSAARRLRSQPAMRSRPGTSSEAPRRPRRSKDRARRAARLSFASNAVRSGNPRFHSGNSAASGTPTEGERKHVSSASVSTGSSTTHERAWSTTRDGGSCDPARLRRARRPCAAPADRSRDAARAHQHAASRYANGSLRRSLARSCATARRAGATAASDAEAMRCVVPERGDPCSTAPRSMRTLGSRASLATSGWNAAARRLVRASRDARHPPDRGVERRFTARRSLAAGAEPAAGSPRTPEITSRQP
jgi:hypothetical protein